MAYYLYTGTENSETFVIDDGEGIVSADAGSDTVRGGDGDDVFSGGSGDDVLTGGAGDDVLRGGSGRDSLYGDAGDDILIGDSGEDLIDGGQGDDIIYGGADDDTLIGGAGKDVFLFGRNEGDDYIIDFQPGEDKIDLSLVKSPILFDDLQIIDLGNGGVTVTHAKIGTINLQGVSAEQLTAEDFVLPSGASSGAYKIGSTSFSTSDSRVDGGDGPDFILTSEGRDQINAGDGTNIVLGGEGDDRIAGGSGTDFLLGEEGRDVIHGGGGGDYLAGGSGADEFVFKADHGYDFIEDFRKEDKIKIDTSGLNGLSQYSDLQIYSDSGDTVIETSAQGGGTIRLLNIHPSLLDADNFEFYDSGGDPDGF